MNSQNIKFPLDWTLQTVSEIGILSKGRGIAKDEILASGLPCIRYGEIYTIYDNYFFETVSFINKTSAEASQEVVKGDLLFAGSGETAEEIGKCVAYVGDEKIYAGGDIIILRPKRVDSIFLAHVLNFDYVVKQKAIFSQGHSVVHIYPSAIGQLKIHLAPIDEQKRIAQILSAWDKLIDTQAKLIAAKEKRKQALMQKLLSGEVRFKGYDGRWVEKRIEDICPLQRGFDLTSTNLKNGKFPVVYSNGTGNYHVEFKVKGPGVVTGRSGTIGKVFYIKENFWPHNTSLWVTDFCGNDPKFIYYFLTQIDLTKYDAGTSVPSLNRNNVHIVLAKVPPITEQKKIATLLSACDIEIQTLETELDAMRQQKKGLIQNLLTGKIRVNV